MAVTSRCLAWRLVVYQFLSLASLSFQRELIVASREGHPGVSFAFVCTAAAHLHKRGADADGVVG